MAEEETNTNTNEPNQNTNSTESVPVNASIADNNTSQASRNPRRKKKAITVKIIQEKSNQPKIANWIAVISAAISLALGVITLYLYFEAQKATKLTHEALQHQITKDSNDNIIRIRKDTLDSIADAAKLKRDTDFIKKQSKGIDSQIVANNQTQKNFNLINRAFLQATAFNPTIKDNKIIQINFTMINIGAQPAKTMTANIGININYKGVTDTTVILKVKKPEPKKANFYIAAFAPIEEHLPIESDIDSVHIKDIFSGKASIYIYGSYIYKNVITNKTYYYKFIAEYNTIANGYNMIVNENTVLITK